MKTGIQINITETEAKNCKLLLELGDAGMTWFWHQNAPEFALKGLAVVEFEPFEDREECVKQLVAKFKDKLPDAEEVSLFIHTKEFILLPSAYDKEEQYRSMFTLMFGEHNSMSYHSSSFMQNAIVQVSGLLEATLSPVNNIVSKKPFKNTGATLFDILEKEQILYCHLWYNQILVMLKIDGKLQLMQTFSYVQPEDISYYLLQICTAHKTKPEHMPLLLSGMITNTSNLYQQLYNFFLDIDFLKFPMNIELEEEWKEFPEHTVSHLIYLSQCAS